jgi:hypothetical protein
MKCPNCGKEMIDKSYSKLEEFYHWEDEDYYYRKNYYEKFVCNDCKISFEDDEWHIPNNLMPTEKQKKTILFINNHLRMDLEALTKHQCWLDIGKYFEEAKKTPLYSKEDYWDMQEYFCMCEGDFC